MPFAAALDALVGLRAGAVRLSDGLLHLALGGAQLDVACAWRVEAPGGMVGPRMPDAGALLADALGERAIERVAVEDPALDLALSFEGGVVLRLFCDRRHLGGQGSHYRLHGGGRAWRIGQGGEVRVGAPKEQGVSERAEAKAFEEALAALVGQRCWCAVPLSSEGLCHFGFGAKIPREQTLPNSEVPDVFRLYYAEFALIVECAWRLDAPGRVVAGAREALARDGRLPRALSVLDGCEVASAEVRWPAGDLVVRFTDGLELKLFCDRLDLDRSEDNYTLHGAGGEVWVVGPRGEVRLEAGPSGPGPVLRVVK